MTHRTLARFAFLAGLGFSAACGGGGGGTGTKTAGAPASMSVNPTSNVTALANTNVSTPIVVTVLDANNVPVPNQTVSFAVTGGGGSLTGTTTLTTDANGQVTAPTWKFGKTAIAQKLTATQGSITKDINGTVITAYNIDVRFFGSRPVSAAHQALFTAAAQRLMAIITGDVPDVTGQIDMSQCGVSGLTTQLNETVDDVVIFASSDTIDGPGKILGQAGPCYIRNPGVHTTIAGVMQFDKDDLDALLTNGLAQDVITHEMLHVIGIGTLWDLSAPITPEVHLLTGKGTADPRFTGTNAIAGCQAVGGTITCASTVPVEGNSEPAGTRDSHWRDHSPNASGGTFGNELMTGYINATGANPLSLLSVRSLTDVGYTVNQNDADSYTIPGGVLRASIAIGTPFEITSVEQLMYPKFAMTTSGVVTKLPPPSTLPARK